MMQSIMHHHLSEFRNLDDNEDCSHKDTDSIKDAKESSDIDIISSEYNTGDDNGAQAEEDEATPFPDNGLYSIITYEINPRKCQEYTPNWHAVRLNET